MTPDQLKELERLNERWANPDNFKNDTAISHAVMDLLPDVIQALKEREGLMANLDYSVNLAVATATEKLTAERDAALSESKKWEEGCRVNSENCATALRRQDEQRLDILSLKKERDAVLKALDAANAKCADLQLTIDGLNVGYHADSEWEMVVEALKRVMKYLPVLQGAGYLHEDRLAAQQALAHAERITGGAQ